MLLAIPGAARVAAATAASQLFTFGANEYGQLGTATNNGNGKPNPTPAPIALPGAGGLVTQVSTGAKFSLVTTSAGQLYAFGLNQYGQLGSATNAETTNANPVPTPISLPEATGPVTAFAAGPQFALAATSTGQLYSFGENEFGQLGNTSNIATSKANPTPTLVTLPGASGPVTQIAAGGDHSLVLTSTDQLYSFGYNYYGQLGTTENVGTGNPNPTPRLIGLPGATGPITEISAGAFQSLVLTSTGQLYSFGNNQFGELGTASKSGTEMPTATPTPVSLPGATGPVTQIASGGFFSLAATSTGQLYSFGENRFGQLGNTMNIGTENANPTPTLVGLPGATGSITLLSAGGRHSLVATSGSQLYAFGLNGSGQLGNPINSGTATANPTPVPVEIPTGGTIQAVGQGEAANHALVLVGEATPLAPGVTPIALPKGGPASPRPPVLTAVSLTNKRFRVARRDTAISAAKIPLGTSFRFVLSALADVRIAFTRSAAGLRSGHRCVAPSSRLRRGHAKHCTRTLTVGTLTRRNIGQGAGLVAFSGRLGHRALRPGSYRALLSATNSGGRSTSVAVSFTVVR